MHNVLFPNLLLQMHPPLALFITNRSLRIQFHFILCNVSSCRQDTEIEPDVLLQNSPFALFYHEPHRLAAVHSIITPKTHALRFFCLDVMYPSRRLRSSPKTSLAFLQIFFFSVPYCLQHDGKLPMVISQKLRIWVLSRQTKHLPTNH